MALEISTIYKINIQWLITGEGSMFIEETELLKFLKEKDLSESEAIKLLEHCLKSPSKQTFELLMLASQGDKEALTKLRHYLDSLEMLF